MQKNHTCTFELMHSTTTGLETGFQEGNAYFYQASNSFTRPMVIQLLIIISF